MSMRRADFAQLLIRATKCINARQRETGEGVPVRSLRVPSHVPSHPQTTAKVRGFSLTAARCTAETDWLLEQSGFEL
jgi:hypothetical protein